jgi:SAM-dependent methyltransferase
MVRCKICGGATELQGCVDSGRSCARNRGAYLPLSGIPIYYHRCTACGFLFATDFDAWSVAEFQQRIYNESYAQADPDYADGSRAKGNAVLTANVMGQLKARSILDYGGGDGTLACALLEKDFEAHSWDPIANSNSGRPPRAYFDLVTSFEVLEHTTTPLETVREAISFLRPGGTLLFSTMIMDEVPRQSTDHWYIAPRNGHISLYTRSSLDKLFESLGWKVEKYKENYYFARGYLDAPSYVLSSIGN